MNQKSKAWLWLAVCCVIGTAAPGCATTQGDLKHGLGAGEWQARLPTTASPIHELAYGRGGSGQASDDSLADLGNVDELLHPAPIPVAQPKPKAVKHAAAPARLAANAATPEAAPSALIAEPAAPQPAAAAPVLLAENDAHDRYASREQQAQPQQKFRGGDAVIVISATTLVVVLLIVLLILLLR